MRKSKRTDKIRRKTKKHKTKRNKRVYLGGEFDQELKSTIANVIHLKTRLIYCVWYVKNPITVWRWVLMKQS